MNKPRQIILNRMKLPCGKVITSYSQHDYKTWVDNTNGKKYMIDGGNSYVRISSNGDEELLTEWYSDDHDANAKAMHWAGYGVMGDQPLHYRPIRDLTSDHIVAILTTQTVAPHYKKTFIRELEVRGDGRTLLNALEGVYQDLVEASM